MARKQNQYGETHTDGSHEVMPTEPGDLQRGYTRKPLTDGRYETDQGSVERNPNLRESDDGFKWD